MSNQEDGMGPESGFGICGIRRVMGCARAINSAAELYRCLDCGVAFHQDCLRQHFGTQHVKPLPAFAISLSRLRSFSLAMLDFAENGDIDPSDVQELAVKHGLLEAVEVAAPCEPSGFDRGCACSEFHDWPRICYRRTALAQEKRHDD